MTAIETIHVADALAGALDGDYHDGLEVHIDAGAHVAQTGRVVLLVTTTEIDPETGIGGDGIVRTFRFLGEEVRS